ncbi:MAG: hypothetical protein CL610_13640 [Anaerolineaceae bacterium]|nr:hypothetical protein [Anaerolineaceae bacterium]
MKYLSIILIGLILTSGGQAQEVSPDLLTQIESIETFVTATRDLDTLNPVDRRFPAREDAVEQIKGIYAEEIPPEESERLSQFYIAFDFLPPGSDYVALYLDALEAQVGGFYDSVSKEMNTLMLSGDAPGDKLPLLEQITYAHEFTHALQDQHFDLEALDAVTSENPDQGLALLALIEGDATLVMNAYVQAISERNPLGTAMQLLTQGFSTDTLFLPPGLPDIVVSELLSSYTEGAAFVGVLQAEGGWEAVDAAFQPENLPQSSEQILHPAKYLSGEGPLTIDLTDPTLDPIWETVWDTTFGEFYLREYLKNQLSNRPAAQAAAGWGGDNYQIYRNTETGELAWLMRIEWDTGVEAAEFTDAYVDFLAARFEGVIAQDSCWSTDTEAMCFTDDETSHLLASAPTLAMAQDLIASQG